MKRLFAIGLSLLMLVGFSADAVAMSDGDEEPYLGWNLHNMNSSALVVAEDVSDTGLALETSGCDQANAPASLVTVPPNSSHV